jgi:hypothetical protein
MEAGAAQISFLDEEGSQTSLRGGETSFLAGRTGSDNNNLILVTNKRIATNAFGWEVRRTADAVFQMWHSCSSVHLCLR